MEELNLNVDTNSHKKSNKKKFWIGVIGFTVLLIIIIALAVSLTDDSSSTSNTKLNITSVQLSVDYTEYLGYSASITGTAKNVTKRDFSYASVEYALYDAEGNNLGTALANINNLLSGDTWRFEATLFAFPSSRPVSYKLVEIKAF